MGVLKNGLVVPTTSTTTTPTTNSQGIDNGQANNGIHNGNWNFGAFFGLVLMAMGMCI